MSFHTIDAIKSILINELAHRLRKSSAAFRDSSEFREWTTSTATPKRHYELQMGEPLTLEE